MPGGGFIFTTSNVAFKGMPLERYELIMDLRKKHGRYS
jgi:uroporphyrinogen decarboxylase